MKLYKISYSCYVSPFTQGDCKQRTQAKRNGGGMAGKGERGLLIFMHLLPPSLTLKSGKHVT